MMVLTKERNEGTDHFHIVFSQIICVCLVPQCSHSQYARSLNIGSGDVA